MTSVRPPPDDPRPRQSAASSLSRSDALKRDIYLKVMPIAGFAALTVGVAGSFDPGRSTTNWLIAAMAGVALLAATVTLAARPGLLRRVEPLMVGCAVAGFVAALIAVVASSGAGSVESLGGVVRIGSWTAAIAGFAHLALPARLAAWVSAGVWATLAVATSVLLAVVRHASISDRTTLFELLLVHGCAVVIIGGIVRVTRAERERASTMAHIAGRDTLTGLANRRVGAEILATEVAHCRRSGEPLSLAWMDLDRFKQINDRYGHDVGDRVLKTVAGIMSGAVRARDTVARWGGEEFVVLFPGQSVDDAHQAAERLRAAIFDVDARLPDREPVTASFGVAELAPSEVADDLLRRADQALLAAKRAGRDRVVRAGGPA